MKIRLGTCKIPNHATGGEVKQLCGSAKTAGHGLTSILHPDLVCDDSTLANKINKAFVSVMED